MAVTVKKTTLWRKEVDNVPGMLANTLEPLAQAGADLQVVMGFRDFSTTENKAIIELLPISGRKATEAARRTGLGASPISFLQVQGDNRAGLGHAIAKAISEAGVNIRFVTAQVVGRKYAALFGFENEADASKAAALIRRVGVAKKR